MHSSKKTTLMIINIGIVFFVVATILAAREDLSSLYGQTRDYLSQKFPELIPPRASTITGEQTPILVERPIDNSVNSDCPGIDVYAQARLISKAADLETDHRALVEEKGRIDNMDHLSSMYKPRVESFNQQAADLNRQTMDFRTEVEIYNTAVRIYNSCVSK